MPVSTYGPLPGASMIIRATGPAATRVRPVPISPLVARAEVVRAGTKVRRLQAALTTADGTTLVQASAVALRTADVLPATLGDESPSPLSVEAAAPFQFSFFPDPVGYHTAMETKIARGTWGKGPVIAWMRPRVALVEGEATSPLQRLLIVADSASGVAVVLEPAHHTFVNADLTVGQLEETITVTGEAPVVDIRSSRGQVQLAQETLQSLPGAGRLNMVSMVLPGATLRRETDRGVGGLSDRTQTAYSVHGAPEAQPIMDGMNHQIASLTSGTFVYNQINTLTVRANSIEKSTRLQNSMIQTLLTQQLTTQGGSGGGGR